MRPKVVVGGGVNMVGVSGKTWDVPEESWERLKSWQERVGENKKSSMFKVCCHTRQAKAITIVVAQSWGSEVIESYLLVHSEMTVTSTFWGNDGDACHFKGEATEQHSTGAVAILAEPQTKIKPFEAKYLYSRLS